MIPDVQLGEDTRERASARKRKAESFEEPPPIVFLGDSRANKATRHACGRKPEPAKSGGVPYTMAQRTQRGHLVGEIAHQTAPANFDPCDLEGRKKALHVVLE